MSAEPEEGRPGSSALVSIPAALISCVILWLGIRIMQIKQATLREQLVQGLPVEAAGFVKSHDYPGPVFNDFAWGGYLMEALRLPVSIDGRAALHGDDQLARSDRSWKGKPDWAANPLLFSAGVVICPVEEPLTQLLRRDQRFHLVHEDRLAAVFVPSSQRAQNQENKP